MARLALALGAAALLGAALRAGRSGAPVSTPGRAPSPEPPPTQDPSLRRWEPAYLTEYHPDAPASLKRSEGGLYDRHGSGTHPVVRWEQHAADPKRYPFVTVSGDVILRGRDVPYGARIYLEAFPAVVFRLFDTGGHFYGKNKVYRGYTDWKAGVPYKKSAGVKFEGRLYRAAETALPSTPAPGQDAIWIPEPRPYTEPFDIATTYHLPSQKGVGISGTRTRYWVDFDDVVDFPAWLVVQRPKVA